MKQLLFSNAVPTVDSHVGTDNFVICGEELLAARTTQRKHKTSAARLSDEYIKPAVQDEESLDALLEDYERVVSGSQNARGTNVGSAISISGPLA